MSGGPAVSVIMAAYNGAALIGETLASLSAQTRGDFELLVVDDCSTDATREVVRAFPDPRIRLIALEANGGPVRARNRAVAAARGRYIAALDQDDLCHPDRFARQVAFLDARPDVVLVASGTDFLTERGAIRRPAVAQTSPASIGWQLRLGNPIVWSSVMLRADVARRLRPFTRPEILYAEDFDLYHRIGAFGALARIDAPLVTYRQHAGGASQRYEAMMLASATRVLAGAYTPLLGDEAADAAGLIVRHLMHGRPVPDGETLLALSALIVRLRGDYLATTPHDDHDRALIDAALDRAWSGVVRAGLRGGGLTLGQAKAAGQISGAGAMLPRPQIVALAWSRLIGRLRARGVLPGRQEQATGAPAPAIRQTLAA